MTFLPSFQLLALIALLAAAVYTDLRERRIPNNVTVPGLLVGLALAAMVEGGFPFSALAGSGLALLISLPFLILGAIGGGDAKLLIAIGAFVGAGGLLSVVLYGALAGGVLALGSAIFRGTLGLVLVNSGKLFLNLVSLGRWGERFALGGPDAHTIPYGVPIAAGALATWFVPFSLEGFL